LGDIPARAVVVRRAEKTSLQQNESTIEGAFARARNLGQGVLRRTTESWAHVGRQRTGQTRDQPIRIDIIEDGQGRAPG
jgi:hypothetical protein